MEFKQHQNNQFINSPLGVITLMKGYLSYSLGMIGNQLIVYTTYVNRKNTTEELVVNVDQKRFDDLLANDSNILTWIENDDVCFSWNDTRMIKLNGMDLFRFFA